MPQALASEQHFISSDGAQLFYRHWPSQAPSSNHQEKPTIILFHRGHEHSGRMQDVVDKLNMPDADIFAWDARGHGLSDGERGYATHFGELVKDADCFIKHITTNYAISIENIAVIAQSVGAVIAAAWVHDYAPKIRSLILVSPALRVRLYVPLAIPGLRLLLKIKPISYIKSYVKGKLLTHDTQKADNYNNDKLVSPRIAVNILVDLYDTATRILNDAGAIQVPVQFLISGADWVVEQKPQHTLFEHWGANVKEKHVFPNFYHDTLNELNNQLPINEARRFILANFAAPYSSIYPQANLLTADQSGYTFNEYTKLARILPFYHPKTIFYGLFKSYLRSLGKLSTGMRLGVNTGFDSGSTLDYIYQNQAQGFGPLGKIMDRIYLNSIGWRGIRVRKPHLENLLKNAIEMTNSAGKSVQIVDIAAGHGRYILNTLSQLKNIQFKALLRDYSPLNIENGRALIAEMNLQNTVKFEQGDAFDTTSLANLSPRPTIAVVSGLYELFPENKQLQASLAGLATAIEKGGFLIYTNQPWHPQLELIARGLSSHRDGRPWVMRRRTQLEIDQLVATAGFEKIDELIDTWGIFTVSLAKRL